MNWVLGPVAAYIEKFIALGVDAPKNKTRSGILGRDLLSVASSQFAINKAGNSGPAIT